MGRTFRAGRGTHSVAVGGDAFLATPPWCRAAALYSRRVQCDETLTGSGAEPMHLTKFTDYALRTLMYLALQPERLVTIAELARTFGVPASHLMKIVRRLAQRGLIETVAVRVAACLDARLRSEWGVRPRGTWISPMLSPGQAQLPDAAAVRAADALTRRGALPRNPERLQPGRPRRWPQRADGADGRTFEATKRPSET